MIGNYILLVLTILFVNTSFAQNQVINPSMEDTIPCPPIDPIILYCSPWYMALRTPDYYRENCSYIGCCTPVPWLPTGYQMPKTGNSYLGFGVFDKGENQHREFIGGKLTDTLVAGHKYCAEFWVSPANNARYITDDIGIYFSHDSVYNPIVKPQITIIPQVENTQGNIISDTAIWTQIYGEFYAQGGEKYLCIGNFKDDSMTTLDSINSNISNHEGYYYLDDVSVTDCTVGIQEPEKLKFSLSPNPAINKLYVNLEMNFSCNINLEIWDILGKKRMQIVYKNGQRPREIDVGGLMPGIYFLKVAAKGKSSVVKFLKE